MSEPERAHAAARGRRVSRRTPRRAPGSTDLIQAPVCVITGASGGIASGIARRLHRDGYALVLMYRSGCADLAAELGQVGVAGSVLQDADVERAGPVAVERFGRLDAAVFSGGRQADMLKRYRIPPAPPATAESFAYDADDPRDLFDTRSTPGGTTTT